jgi:hypothetical protein
MSAILSLAMAWQFNRHYAMCEFSRHFALALNPIEKIPARLIVWPVFCLGGTWKPGRRQVGGPSWPPVNELTRDWLGMQDLEERKRNIT